MKRLVPAGLGLMLGLAVVLGFVPRAALAAEPTVSCPPAARLHMIHRQSVHHQIVRIWRREIWTPVGCGTTEHPCNVEHVTLPLQ